MIQLSLAEIAEVVGGKLHHATGAEVVTGSVEFDTREVTPGGLFLALPGARVDGHDFAAQAIARGAVGVLALAPGVLWVIFTFSGILGLHRSFGVEQADRAMDALLAAPVDREAIFLGKMLANLAFVLGVQAVALPAAALFYNLLVSARAPS